MTTRDIKIKVTGVQSVAGADDEPEVLELETRGTYSEKNGNRYIKYDEFIEDVEEPVKNLLRFDEHALQLTKRGSVNTVMLFDREKNSSGWTDLYEYLYGGISYGAVREGNPD